MANLDDNIMPQTLDRNSLYKLIRESKNQSSECDKNKKFHHKLCFDRNDSTPIPQCPNAFAYTVVELLANKPELFDEELRTEIAQYYDRINLKVSGLMSLEYLTLLNEKTKTPTLSWIKYENLISELIKKQKYEPKTVANEVLAIVKDEIPANIGAKFASVLESCVKHCRDTNKNIQDEEDEEKWCEIIDWMSWFIGSADQF